MFVKSGPTGRKNGFTRVAKLQHSDYSKCVANTTFAQFCARAKTDIALDLLSVAMTVTSWCKENGQPWISGSFVDGSNVYANMFL